MTTIPVRQTRYPLPSCFEALRFALQLEEDYPRELESRRTAGGENANLWYSYNRDPTSKSCLKLVATYCSSGTMTTKTNECLSLMSVEKSSGCVFTSQPSMRCCFSAFRNLVWDSQRSTHTQSQLHGLSIAQVRLWRHRWKYGMGKQPCQMTRSLVMSFLFFFLSQMHYAQLSMSSILLLVDLLNNNLNTNSETSNLKTWHEPLALHVQGMFRKMDVIAALSCYAITLTWRISCLKCKEQLCQTEIPNFVMLLSLFPIVLKTTHAFHLSPDSRALSSYE